MNEFTIPTSVYSFCRAIVGKVPPPRKSSPSRESPALVCFGGAGSAFGGTALALGGPVLARGGAVSSPNKSIAGAGFACTGGGRFEDEASRWDAERSICTFSCTLLKGYVKYQRRNFLEKMWLTTSSSDTSRVDGSGMPPSITQRFDSYFVRMKFSIFLYRVSFVIVTHGRRKTYASDGIWPCANLASQYLFRLEQFVAVKDIRLTCLPAHYPTSRHSGVARRSKNPDQQTRLICVPIPR